MPNKRAPGQKLLTLPADEKFIAAVDVALRRCGYGNRSQFVREAIVEKLATLNVHVPRQIAAAPSRAGKGGPAKYPPAGLHDGVPSPARSVADQGASNLLHRNVPTPDPELQRRAAKTQRRKAEK